MIFTLLALLAVAESTTVIRVNQVGYLPDAPKVAVLCSLTDPAQHAASFVVRDSLARIVFGPARAQPSGSFGPCASTWR